MHRDLKPANALVSVDGQVKLLDLQRPASSRSRHPNARSGRIAVSLNDLGVFLSEKGDYAAAGRSLEEALTMRRKLLGREHADVAVTLVELARVYQDQGALIAGTRGDYRGAESLFRQELVKGRKTLGDDHPSIAMTLNGLARVLLDQGRYDEPAPGSPGRAGTARS